MTHPGYHVFDGYYSTMRNLEDYQRLHQIDFARLIRGQGLESATVVDLGCGNGNFLADLKREFPNLRVYGVDKKRYVSRLKDTEIIVGDVTTRIPYLDDGVADLVVSTTLTPWLHSERLERFYVEANRILSSKGLGAIFPIGSNRVISEKGIGFLDDMGFDKPHTFRKVKTPEWVDGQSLAVTQLVFGDARKLEPYLI